jgi:hypothetical protein
VLDLKKHGFFHAEARVRRMFTMQGGTVSSRVDGEDAAVQEVVALLKSQDKAMQEQGINTVIQNARKWKLTNCTLVAREIANIQDSKYLTSRALCEIMAAVSIRSAKEKADEFRRFPYRAQWQTGMRPDAIETIRAARDSLRVVNPKLHENIWIILPPCGFFLRIAAD